MDIIWHGYTCFTIKTKEGTAVINPYSAQLGLKLPSLKAAVVVMGGLEPSEQGLGAVQGEPKLIDWPGEYEVSGIAMTVQEVRFQDEQNAKMTSTMLLTLVADNLKICYISDLGPHISGKLDELAEAIGDIDVLILPISSTRASYKEANELVEDLEPRVVIPMRYQTPGLSLELEPIDNFARQAGITNLEAKDKFTINNKNDVSEEKTEYAILAPQLA